MTDEQLRQLVDNYQPNQEVQKQLQQIVFLAVVGATTSGKTTLVKMLCRNAEGIDVVMIETSRPRREGERDGDEYFFRNKEDMVEDLKNGWLVQASLYPTGELYATKAEDYPKNGTALMPVYSPIVPVFRKLPFKAMYTAFIVPASFEMWQQWLAARPTTGEERSKRLQEAAKSYEFALNDSQSRFVLNDELEKACGRLGQVAKGQTPANEEQAREIAKNNYAKLLEILNKSSNL